MNPFQVFFSYLLRDEHIFSSAIIHADSPQDAKNRFLNEFRNRGVARDHRLEGTPALLSDEEYRLHLKRREESLAAARIRTNR